MEAAAAAITNCQRVMHWLHVAQLDLGACGGASNAGMHSPPAGQGILCLMVSVSVLVVNFPHLETLLLRRLWLLTALLLLTT
jgi:hypothetical protein